MPRLVAKELTAIAIIGITFAAVFPLVNPKLNSDFERYGAGAIAFLGGCILADIVVKKIFKDES